MSKANEKPRIVVIGAGFGGLEAARALARLPVRVTVIDRKNHHTFQPLLYQVATAGISPGEIARNVLRHEFASIDPKRTRILLLEGGPRVLPAYAPDLSQSAVRQLEKLGVQVRASAMVTRIAPGAVWVGDERIPAAVVLWAAGVAASPLGKKLGAAVDRAGRVLVNGDLSLPQHSEVFVICDLAFLKDEHGNPLPGVAPVAMQQGRSVARTVAADLQNAPRKTFHYVDKGSLATIGRAAAVAQFRKLHVSGYFAWLAWLFVHIFFLIGFRNRLIVLIQWAWSYVTYERGARLITGGSSLPGWSESETKDEAEPAARG